jgi:hypothetical protein
MATAADATVGTIDAYVANFGGQGPTARLVYVNTDWQVRELRYVASQATTSKSA